MRGVAAAPRGMKESITPGRPAPRGTNDTPGPVAETEKRTARSTTIIRSGDTQAVAAPRKGGISVHDELISLIIFLKSHSMLRGVLLHLLSKFEGLADLFYHIWEAVYLL